MEPQAEKRKKAPLRLSRPSGIEDLIPTLQHEYGFKMANTRDSEKGAVERITLSRDQTMLYATDRNEKTVKKFTIHGKTLSNFERPSGTAGDALPVSITALSSNRVVVSYIKGGGIVNFFDNHGHFLSTLQTPCPNCPLIGENSKGQLVVLNRRTGEGYFCWEDGKEISKLISGPTLKNPKHAYVDDRDWVYICTGKEAVHVYDTDLTHVFSYEGQEDFEPYGACTDSYGNILVADWKNGIHFVSPDGKFKKMLLTKTDGIVHPRDVIATSDEKLIVAHCEGKVEIYNYNYDVESVRHSTTFA